MSFDWSELGTKVAQLGLPLLGAVLPIPGGAAIGTALAAHIGAKSADPSDIFAALTSSGDAIEKAKEFQMTHQETMLRIQLDYDAAMRKADSADIASVNTTMQEEAKSGKMAEWREACGYVVAINSFIATVASCLLFYKALSGPAEQLGMVVSQIPLLVGAIGLATGVPGAAVGITAWHQGKADIKSTITG